MTEGSPIGTGRYRLLSTLPATLPRIVRHLGYDTILDRDVTILALTAATPHRDAESPPPRPPLRCRSSTRSLRAERAPSRSPAPN